MRKAFLLPFVVVGCTAFGEQQQLLNACDAHDRGVRALTGFAAAGTLSQQQVGAVDSSIAFADTICEGTVTNYRGALSALEAELLRLAIIQSTVEE